MLEDTNELIGRYQAFLEYSEEISRELESPDPASIGQQVRVETIEQPWVVKQGIELIVRDQLWENQIDMNGNKLPAYKPSTLRKKIKKFGSWDRANYVYFDTGYFYNNGLYIYVDAATDTFTVQSTDERPYFQYIEEHNAIGWTEENFAYFMEFLDSVVRSAQYDKFIELMNEAGYGDFI